MKTQTILVLLSLIFTGCATPLRKAVSANDMPKIKRIVEAGANVRKESLVWVAAQSNILEPLEYLLENGGDANEPGGGFSPLERAISGDYWEAAKILLKHGADAETAVIQHEEFGRRNSSAKHFLPYRARANRLRKMAGLPIVPESSPTAAASARTSRVPPALPVEQIEDSDIDTPSYLSEEHPDDFAIVIGIENYADLPKASFALRDASAVKRHLMALGYPERNIVHLTDSQATKSGIQKNLEVWLPNNVTERSNVFFYYSGHGAPDTGSGDAYLLPVDGDPAYLEVTGYSMKRLYAKLSALKVKRVFVAVDSCFSGAGGRSVLAKGTRPLLTKVNLGEITSNKIVAWSASQSQQISGTIKDQGHGLFTYYLLKGLNGAAIKGGQVTAKSLHNYLRPMVQNEARRQNREQTPTLHTALDVVIRSN